MGIATLRRRQTADAQGRRLRRRQLRRGHVRPSGRHERDRSRPVLHVRRERHQERAADSYRLRSWRDRHRTQRQPCQRAGTARRPRGEGRSSRPRATPKCCCISTRARGADSRAGARRVHLPGPGRILARAADQGSTDRGREIRTDSPAHVGTARRRHGGVVRDLRVGPDRRAWIRDVEPGEMLVVGPEGETSLRPFAPAPRPTVCLSTSTSRGPTPTSSARASTRCARSSAAAWPRAAGSGRCRRADSGLWRVRGHRFCRRGRLAPADGPDPESLRRPHVHRTASVHPALWCARKLNPVRSILNGRRVVLVDDSIVRGTTSRKIVKMVRAAGATEVHMRISCPPTISPVSTASTRPAVRTDRRDPHARRDSALHRRRFARVLDRRRLLRRSASTQSVGLRTSCYTARYRSPPRRTRPPTSSWPSKLTK